MRDVLGHRDIRMTKHIAQNQNVSPVHHKMTSETMAPLCRRCSVLDEHLQPDVSVPVYQSIPLSVHMSGHESGLLSYPLEGSVVDIAFAYGCNDRPIIHGIYGREYALPSIEPGEQLQQQRDEVSTRIDAAGNTINQTDQTQTSIAFEKIDKVDRYHGKYGQLHIDVGEHSTEEVTGKKLIEALGAINLLAGDDIVLGSLGDMQTATAGGFGGNHR